MDGLTPEEVYTYIVVIMCARSPRTRRTRPPDDRPV